MSYKLVISKRADKDLSKIDKPEREKIYRYLNNNIHGIEDPRSLGKQLKGNLNGLWRYRVGKYRIIVEIKDDELIVIATEVGIRGSIYKR